MVPAMERSATTMKNHTLFGRASAAILGGILLTGVAGAAMAADYGDDTVDVNVEIAELNEPGVLAMTVAGTSVALTETESTDLVRQFTGTLPTVTVTDTRSAEQIPDGAGWYVLGTATDFVGDAGQPRLTRSIPSWMPGRTR